MPSAITQFVVALAALAAGALCLARAAPRLASSTGLARSEWQLAACAAAASAPVVAVAIASGRAGATGIALGVVVGANVFMILFVLAACALVAPVVVDARSIRRRTPWIAVAASLLVAAAWNGVIGYVDGAILALLFVACIAVAAFSAGRGPALAALDAQPVAREARPPPPTAIAAALVVAGIALLAPGARGLLRAALRVAEASGAAEPAVGLTVVAAGVSLPAAAFALAAFARGERNLAVGTVVVAGTSNVFAGLGVAALLSPAGLAVAPAFLRFDAWVLVASACALLPLAFAGGRIGRAAGAAMLACYAAFAGYLVLGGEARDGLPRLPSMALVVAVPLVALALAALATRGRRPPA
ncbi:Inner membrane protein YrbG [Burkholderiales bacterium]|nr:Inner membrane protein YrbG [Burkholderiales bacterium]